MAKQIMQELHDEYAETALAGVREIKEFLTTYRGKDPERLRRVQIALGTVSGYTRLMASRNNMVSMMLIAARQTGLGSQQTLDIAKEAGLLPEASQVVDLKIAK